MEQVSIEMWGDEALKLLRMEVDDLYATLGGQLLGHKHPALVAGMISYLSAVRSASVARSFYEALPAGPALAEWSQGLGVIYEELKRGGVGFITEVSQALRKTLCNEDILSLSEQVDSSTMQVIVVIVGAVLRMPREFDPISVTVAAILVKIGLRNFCRQGTA